MGMLMPQVIAKDASPQMPTICLVIYDRDRWGKPRKDKRPYNDPEMAKQMFGLLCQVGMEVGVYQRSTDSGWWRPIVF